jgi:hypothetical protein
MVSRSFYTSAGTTGPNFAFRDDGLPFVNQIALEKTKGIGLAG